MTRLQKEITVLQREIKKLRRNNFDLTKENKMLKRELFIWQRDYKTALTEIEKVREEIKTLNENAAGEDL